MTGSHRFRQQIAANSAQILSFEGDVRVTRASTRETIVVTRPTFVAAGDTIQTQADGRAVLKMVDGSIFTVKPNSTIVVETIRHCSAARTSVFR